MKKKNIIVLCSIFLVVVILAISTSYALFHFNVTKNSNFKIALGTLELTIKDTATEDKFILTSVVPTKDDVALKQEGYKFTLTNTGTIDSYYSIYLDDILLNDVGDRLDDKYIKINLENNSTNKNKTIDFDSYSDGDRVITTGVLKKGESVDYTLRMWVKYETGNEAQNKYFATQIRVVGTQLNAVTYKEKILNGADPVLNSDLTPVIISQDGTVIKADTNEEWYSYENKNWANAVILNNSYNELSNKGNISGATKNDNYVSLDGVDDYINLGYENYDFGNSFTLALKTKLYKSNVKQYLFGNSQGAGFGIYYFPDSKIKLEVYDSSTSNWQFIESTNGYDESNRILNIVFTYDGSNIKLYINGNLEASKEFNKNTSVSTVPIFIGANPEKKNHTYFSKQDVYKAAIFKDALTEEEIKEYYSNDIMINDTKDLLSYQNFEGTLNYNEIIPEDNIKQYYVWIPRYRYQLWNVNGENKYPNGDKESAINIVFESKNTNPSTGTQNGEWLTHPAFTSFNTNGIWVGKFETSYDEETYTDSSKFLTTNPNYSVATEANNIIIKPNVRSLTNKNVSTFYTLGRGINEGLNSHMMKNSEWGAVAYLTYSLYGKCTETGCEEVYLNNVNTGYLNSTSQFTGQWQSGTTITGCSASSTSSTVNSNKSSCEAGYAYNEVSNKASTTGNISGIYDMSGGNWECVMAVIKDESGNPMSGRNNKYNSGFNGTYGCPTCNSDTSGLTSLTTGINFPTDTRYYDTYTANSTELGDDTWYKYENGHLGDATKEVAVSKENASSGNRSLWYQDYTNYFTFYSPLTRRGGGFDNETGAGIYYLGRYDGHAGYIYSFRVVLAPAN